MGKAKCFHTVLVFISNGCCEENSNDGVGGSVGSAGNAAASGVGDVGASNDSGSGGNGAKSGDGSGSDSGDSSSGRDGGVNGDCGGNAIEKEIEQTTVVKFGMLAVVEAVQEAALKKEAY